MTAHLVHVLEGLKRPRILVVGDLMLDHYVFGKVERISPEAPIQILKVDREENKPGGAGSVVAMLRRLEAEVAVVGAVGRDEAGDELVAALAKLGADVSGIERVAGRPTTLKTRFIASVQHVLRVDREVDSAYPAAVDEALKGHVRRLLPACDLVSISDYGKGLLKGGLLREVDAERRRLGKAAILDPKKQADYSMYRGVTAITPNRAETELASGIRPAEGDPASWRAAGEKLCRDLDVEVAVITLDKEGMYFHPRAGEGRHFPTQARSVYDVTGAGDMVVSVIALSRASGVDWPDALALANVAAGVEVSRVGVAPLSRREVLQGILERDQPFLEKILTAEQFLAEALPELRRKQKKIVFTNGCFDILHVGHVSLFTFARAQGDCLVVGLNSDRSVREIKGPGRPIIGEADRAHLVAALAAVDFVILFDGATPLALIEAILPDVLIKAEDYRGRTVVGQAAVEQAGGKVVLAPLVGGISTTEIARRLAETQALDAAAAGAARAAAEQAYAQAEAKSRGGSA